LRFFITTQAVENQEFVFVGDRANHGFGSATEPPQTMQTTMSPLSKQILSAVDALPDVDQRQVLDFVDFLRVRRSKLVELQHIESERSFFEVAEALIGAGEGPGDLSTNAKYLKGYGIREERIRLLSGW
jgi:hypothetical protein